jgi:hypothetical protein
MIRTSLFFSSYPQTESAKGGDDAKPLAGKAMPHPRMYVQHMAQQLDKSYYDTTCGVPGTSHGRDVSVIWHKRLQINDTIYICMYII